MIKEVLRLMKNQNIHQIYWSFLDRLFKLIFSLTIITYLAKNIGPSDYGIYSISLSVAIIGGTIIGLGLDQLSTKLFLNDNNNLLQNLASIFIIKYIVSIFFTLISLLVLSLFIKDLIFKNQLSIVVLTFLFIPFNTFDPFFRSTYKVKYLFISSFLRYIIMSLIIVYLIYNKQKIEAFLYTIILDQIILSLFYLFFFLKYEKFQFSKMKFKISDSNKILKPGLLLLLSSFLGYLILRSDQFFIKFYLGNNQLGIYSAAVNIYEMFLVLPSIILTGLFPYFVTIENNKKLLFKRFQRICSLNIVYVLFIVMFWLLLGNIIVNFLFGIHYALSPALVNLFLISVVFSSLGIVTSSFFIINKMESFILTRSLISLAINIFINILFLEEYGLKAAVISTIISSFYLGYLSDFFHKESKELFWIKTKILTLNLIDYEQETLEFKLLFGKIKVKNR
jgi:O-antigen/teichoic acid export membrane protein